MVNPQEDPSILDLILKNPDDPFGVNPPVPQSLAALAKPGVAPATPTLGTDEQLQAPAKNLPDAQGTFSADGSTLTLPPKDNSNSESSTSLSPSDHVGILKTIGRLAGGLTGLENPNSSPQAGLGAKLGRLIGRTGEGLAMAAGTPEQKQLAEEESQVPLKQAQLQSEIQYRQGMLGNTANKNDISQHKNLADEAIKQQGVDQNYLKLNMVPDEQHPGMHRAATPEETLANPFLQQNSEMRSAAVAAKNASSTLQNARQQALTNPDSLTQKNFIAKLEEQERVAMAQLAVAGSRLKLSQQANDRQNQEMLLNYGQGPSGAGAGAGPAAGAPGQAEAQPGGLSLSNAPDLMMVNPTTGLPIPMKMLAALKPTQQEIQRSDFASSAMHSADKIAQLVEQAKAQVGPFSGRTAELMAKAGLGDQFNQELQNYVRFTQSAATAAHTGRFSVPILDKMDKMIGPEMNPDQLTGAIASIKGQMAPYADQGWKPTVWEYRAWLNNATTKPSGAKAPQDANVVEYERGIDGKLHPKQSPKGK